MRSERQPFSSRLRGLTLSPSIGLPLVAPSKTKRREMVVALTAIGIHLNHILVLPISDELTGKIREVERRIDSFRLAAFKPDGTSRRDDVSPALQELFALLRQDQFLL